MPTSFRTPYSPLFNDNIQKYLPCSALMQTLTGVGKRKTLKKYVFREFGYIYLLRLSSKILNVISLSGILKGFYSHSIILFS